MTKQLFTDITLATLAWSIIAMIWTIIYEIIIQTKTMRNLISETTKKIEKLD